MKEKVESVISLFINRGVILLVFLVFVWSFRYNDEGEGMQRYFALERIRNEFTLRNEDYFHILRVMRCHENDQIEVVHEKTVYLCALKDTEIETRVEIISILERGKDEREMVVCVPFLKETKVSYILQKGTEMGATKFIFYPAQYSVVKMDEEKLEKRKERWQKIVKEASEQSKRNMIPEIEVVDHLQDLKDLKGVKLVCSTREKEKTLKIFLQSQSNCDTLVVVIGPEGGLDPDEEKQLNEMGYTSVSLGSRILRVESVPLFVLSCVNYEFME